MNGRSVRDAMSRRPVVADPDLTVEEVAERMRDEHVGSVVVMRNGHVVGMVTDRDLVVRAVASGFSPRHTRVLDITTTDPVWVSPDTPATEALDLMAQHRVRRLPVIDDGRLVGVVSRNDLERPRSDGPAPDDDLREP